MSSLSRNALRRRLVAAGLLAALGQASFVSAQQTYFVPAVQLSAEANTNRRLDPLEKETSEGYKARFEGIWRRVSPRDVMEIHPQITYQDYPQFKGREKLEGALDLRLEHQTLKGLFTLDGRYQRLDTLNAELGQAAFNGGDPDSPTDDPESAGTGRIVGGITRTSYGIEPQFDYSFTPLTDFESDVRLTKVDYSTDLPKERVGYQSPYASFNIVHAVSPRLRVGAGPYYEQFKTDDDSNTTDAYGVNVDLRYKVTSITRSVLSVNVEKNDIDQRGVKDSTTAWGVQWTGETKRSIGDLRYAIGRFLEASSVGARLKTDQIRLQYRRPISPRLSFDGAIRARRERGIGNADATTNRDRANVEVSLKAFMTPTTFISGGYRFAWQDIDTDPSSAENHGVFIAFGFRGREPPR